MVKLIRFSILSLLALGIVFVAADRLSVTAAGEQDESVEVRSDQDEERESDFDPESAEQRLEEIEKLIDRAEREEDVDRIRTLRREGERLLDQLEEFERARLGGDEEEEREEEEMKELERNARRIELHRMELELERQSIELGVVRQEAAMRLAEISKDKYASASYALTQMLREFEEPEEQADLLAKLLEETKNDEILSRLLRHRLAPLYQMMGRPDEARRQFRSLILGR